MANGSSVNQSGVRWYSDWDTIVEFAQVLVDADVLETPGEVVDYFESPRKYNKHYQLWTELDRPEVGDENWREFYNAT